MADLPDFFELDEAIATDEFRVLNRCLDNAIAQAVTEFAYHHDAAIVDRAAHALNERLGFLAHELRNHVHTATLALGVLRTGNVGLSGATGTVLDRSLIGLRDLINGALADARLTAGMPARHQLLSLARFISEVQSSAALEAQSCECELNVAAVNPDLAVDADRDLLFSAVGNLLQNAFKYTGQGTEVSLNAYAVADRVVIDVEDQCGGLLPGTLETMFEPFVQGAWVASGAGLGLSICRRAVEASDGVLSVRNLPGKGCVFTISLPRRAIAQQSVVE